ncbi:MAG: hypothetical protein AAFO61_10630 [Pseudomonadota bacterium]
MTQIFKTTCAAIGLASLGLLAFAISPALADIHCASEPGISSANSNVATNMVFKAVGENDETQFKIYWINFEGQRQEYRHLFAGETWSVNTYLSHPWLVTAPVPGGGEDCIAIYLPTENRRTVVLD